MKIIYFILLIFCCGAHANYIEQYLLELEEPQRNENQSQFQNTTRDALFAMDGFQERANHLVLKLKNLTFGEYADEVMILAPFVTGDIEFQAMQLRFYYNHFDSEGGVRYQLSF